MDTLLSIFVKQLILIICTPFQSIINISENFLKEMRLRKWKILDRFDFSDNFDHVMR